MFYARYYRNSSRGTDLNSHCVTPIISNVVSGSDDNLHGMHRRMISVVNFFVFCQIINSFCFVVAISDLVHAVETMFHLSYVLTASGNLF